MRVTFVALAIFLTSLANAAVPLVKNGEPLATIYVRGPLTVPALTAAQLRALNGDEKDAREDIELLAAAVEDLIYHVEQMSGATLPIRVYNTAAEPTLEGPAILIGDLATERSAETTVMRESYRIVAADGVLQISGESALGTSHGIYALLRSLGCDWIMPGVEGEIIPTMRTITVADQDVTRKPAFELRAQWYSGGRRIIEAEEYAQLAVWKRRQGQTPRSHADRHPDFLVGGHFWASLIGKNLKGAIAEDPTMLALVRKPDGTYERGRAQLDPVHPGVLEMSAAYIREYFEKQGWPKDKAVAFSIGPNDGGGYSESAEALAAGSGRFDPVTGDRDQTDVLILYANRLIEMLEPEFPNLKLGFYIYSVHAEYPMRYTPHPKFVAHFADITYSRYHSTLDPRSATRTYFRNILEQWGALHEKQGNPMWYYGYNWNLAENLLPYSKMKIWGEELPYLHQLGVLGQNNEQDKSWANLGPHNYLLARMGWDMTLDWREVLRDYCQMAFGDGGEYVEQYYLALIERQESAGQEAGCHFAMPQIYDQAFVAEARALFAKAEKAAKTEIQKKRVDYYSEPVEMLGLYLTFIAAMRSFDFVEAKAQHDAMVAHWDKYLALNPNLVSRYGRRYMKWLYQPVAEQGLTYSTGDYQIVHRVPEELPTYLDPNVRGHLMGMQNPAFAPANPMTTHTYSSTWMAQGLGGYRQGAVWYRDTFTLDGVAADQGIGLFVGAVEDEVHVWCNGEYVGKGRGYVKPFQFDLTDFVTRDGENTIALQVIRNSYLNELGLGGILYPCFVFAGPRLENQAPAIAPLQRVLPGAGQGL